MSSTTWIRWRWSLVFGLASSGCTLLGDFGEYSQENPEGGSTGEVDTTGGSKNSGGNRGDSDGDSGGGTDTAAGGKMTDVGSGSMSSGSGGKEGSGGNGTGSEQGSGGEGNGSGSGGDAPESGGSNSGGSGGGDNSGGSGSGGSGSGGDNSGGSGSGGAPPVIADGPCDIYNDAGNECVAAFSTIRRILSTYTGPLYQIRTGSSATNSGSGGTLIDVQQTTAGFADAASVSANCGGTICTVAKLYDQSGRGNDLTVAKAGLSNGGMYSALDDFETLATAGAMKVGGHDVYALYMEVRQGYRLQAVGNGMPVDKEPQGIYLLADGTRFGSACCWDFGNVTTNPKSYHEMNTLFFGKAYWGKGAGNGPWFGADFEAGVWMGGSNPGDAGWGGLNDTSPTGNPNNPSLGVRYALGFQKTKSSPAETYALRMADLANATAVQTAYEGAYPSGKTISNVGGIVLGVGSDNSNNSYSTFYEGAIVKGYPADATELAVMKSIQAVGY